MAVGPAKPNAPQHLVTPEVVSTPHPSRLAEELRKADGAKSVPEINAQDEVQPTGEDIHSVARQMSAQTAEGKAAHDAGRAKLVAADIVNEAVERKTAALAAQDKDADAHAAKNAEAQARLDEQDRSRKEAADKMAEEGRAKQEAARKDAAQKAKADADKK